VVDSIFITKIKHNYAIGEQTNIQTIIYYKTNDYEKLQQFIKEKGV
jgi:hypothetical protein